MRHNRGHNTRRLLQQNNWITDTNVALVKDVHGYDWVFVSNLVFENLLKYVKVYERRWNVETMFRAHDVTRIKSKSLCPVVRLFYFMSSMLVLLVRYLYAKYSFVFKLFVISLSDILPNADAHTN